MNGEKERQKMGQFFTPPSLTIKMIEKFDNLEGTMTRLRRNRMNFDKVIMNPPYMRTLHLQITRKVMEHCDSAVIL